MIKVNVHQAKTHFSEYLEKVAAGETVIVCKRNIPIAEIRAIPAEEPPKSRELRPIGLYKDKITIHDSFWDPLPDDLLDYFDGKK